MTDKTYQPFTKNINFEKSKIKIQVKIEFSAEGRLSIMGMIYEPENVDAKWIELEWKIARHE